GGAGHVLGGRALRGGAPVGRLRLHVFVQIAHDGVEQREQLAAPRRGRERRDIRHPKGAHAHEHLVTTSDSAFHLFMPFCEAKGEWLPLVRLEAARRPNPYEKRDYIPIPADRRTFFTRHTNFACANARLPCAAHLLLAQTSCTPAQTTCRPAQAPCQLAQTTCNAAQASYRAAPT